MGMLKIHDLNFLNRNIEKNEEKTKFDRDTYE